MLNQVPKSVNFAVRQVTLRHPNSTDCAVYRKNVTRTEIVAGNPSEMGGAPTLGGMGVLSSEEESKYQYEDLGDGRILMLGAIEPASVLEANNGLVPRQQVEAQIECAILVDPDKPEKGLIPPEHADYFIAEKDDLILVMPGLGVVLAYEVVDVLGGINIPPYNRKYVLNPRDELNELEPFKSLAASAPEPDPPIDSRTPPT